MSLQQTTKSDPKNGYAPPVNAYTPPTDHETRPNERIYSLELEVPIFTMVEAARRQNFANGRRGSEVARTISAFLQASSRSADSAESLGMANIGLPPYTPWGTLNGNPRPQAFRET